MESRITRVATLTAHRLPNNGYFLRRSRDRSVEPAGFVFAKSKTFIKQHNIIPLRALGIYALLGRSHSQIHLMLRRVGHGKFPAVPLKNSGNMPTRAERPPSSGTTSKR